jgi:glycosyltransferase involved in cell wall biosynthesis
MARHRAVALAGAALRAGRVDPRPFVTIVMPTRNRARLLGAALRSFLDQDYADDRFELVVVDDGSTDDSAAAVARVADARPQVPVRFVRNPGQGVNSARNAGLSEAAGELLCFVDDDTAAGPGWLGAVVNGSETHRDRDVFAGRLILQYEGRPPRICGREPLGETELDLGDADIDTEFAWGANLIVRRRVFALVGPFDESLPIYGDETEWVVRYRRSGGRVMYLADAWLWHRRTAASLRIGSLLGRSFRFGRGWAAASNAIGARCSVAGAVASAIRGLGHGVRFRCFVGFRNAVSGIGTAIEAARMMITGVGGGSISWLPMRE